MRSNHLVARNNVTRKQSSVTSHQIYIYYSLAGKIPELVTCDW